MNAKHNFGSLVLSLETLMLLGLVLALARAPSPAFAQPLADHVSGTITTNTTWTLAGSPYILDDNLYVAAGVTLTIDPGVTMMSTAGWLRVQGDLEALGTPTQPITFTRYPGNDGWQGLYFDGSAGQGTGHLRQATVEYGGTNYVHPDIQVENVTTGTVVIEDSRIRNGFYFGLYVDNGHVSVSNTLFTGFANGGYWPIQVYGGNSVLNLSRSIFQSNINGVYVDAGSATLINNVLMDNTSTALHVSAGANANGLHNTFARNGGIALDLGGSVALTNTILSGNATGVNVAGGSATLNRTLWDNNTTPTIGTVNATGNITGPAAFAADGYHLTRYSLAIQQGINAGVTIDIDGNPRPMPLGTLPDLGAVEYPYPPPIYLPLIRR